MFNPERATIVAVQKHQPLSSVRQMYITVKRAVDGKEISFWWVSAPIVITSEGSYGNKEPSEFGRLWHNEDLEGKEVMLYYGGDASHAFVKLS